MEEYSGRRSKTEIAFLRRGSRFSSSNQSPEERTNHNSDKPRSSTRLTPTKMASSDNQERLRYLHDSFKSSSSKMVPTNSSKFPLRKFEERRRQPLLPGIDIAESSIRKTEAKQLESRSKKVIVDSESSDNLQSEAVGFTTERVPYPACSHFTGPSGVSSHTVESSRTHRHKDKEVNLGTPGASSSFTNRSIIPGNPTIGARPAYGHVSGVQRLGLKNLGCTSVPDAQPSGCPSDSVIRRFEFMRKRASDQESSSRSRNLSLGRSPPTDIRNIGPGIGMNVQSLPQQLIRRRSRNHQESAVSVRTRRSSHSTSLSVPDERADGMLSLHESFTRNGQSVQEHLSLEDVSVESSIRPFSVELPHDIYSSSRRRTSNTGAETARPSSLFEESPPQLFHGLMGQRDGHRRMTMEGIAEVLVALERIEQEAELTYEQLLVLETNLFLRSFVSHDQHRDMRMDIDNMSYEELLALEESIGSVSTALSEEQFTKCLTRRTYSRVSKDLNKSIDDDMKCSICQEEYMEGEEVGRLPCDHQYHVCCIGQWLAQKNWCPVCKAPAAPSLG